MYQSRFISSFEGSKIYPCWDVWIHQKSPPKIATNFSHRVLYPPSIPKNSQILLKIAHFIALNPFYVFIVILRYIDAWSGSRATLIGVGF